ncbi:EF-P lysine aminoacylase GenX, partial [Xanthomonas hortorum pv. gardneri]
YRVGWDDRALAQETIALVQQALALVQRQARVQALSYRDLFLQQLGIDPLLDPIETLRAPLHDIAIDPAGLTRDDWLDLLMTHRIQPSFASDTLTVVHDWPASQCALARIRHDSPPVAERFELYLGAYEVANGYHELNDAQEQRARFLRDNAVRAARGLQQLPLDERLLAVLSQLPDCAGVAVGVDRLLMALRGTAQIADVLAFEFARA